MDRRKTAIIAAVTLGAAAATTAAALGVSAAGSVEPTEQAITAVLEGTQETLYYTNFTLPENYVAFALEGEELEVTGDAGDLNQATLDGIAEQLAAAVDRSIVLVDLDSTEAEGLTTALLSVTPTNGHTVATSNENMQQWLGELFPDHEGEIASLPTATPNADFTYLETDGELTWQVTEYVFQFEDATVSARLSTVDEPGQTKAEFDQLMASMTR